MHNKLNNNKLRIALIAPLVSVIKEPFIGGAQVVIADLAQGLSEKGHSVTLFALEGSFVPGVKIEPVSVSGNVKKFLYSAEVNDTGVSKELSITEDNFFSKLILSLSLRQSEFDLIHAHAFDPEIFELSSHIYKIPIFHTLHISSVSNKMNSVLQERDNRKECNTFIAVSKSSAQSYKNYIETLEVIYNGIDISHVPFLQKASKNSPLLFAGRLSPEKGLEDAIEIAKISNKKLIIVGGIYNEKYYNEKIINLIEENKSFVEYKGQVDRKSLWNLMSLSSGLLFPTKWNEAFGLTIIEAMATGTPVIAYNNAAVKEIIQNNINGFIVESGDINMAAQLVPKLRHISRIACRERVFKNFSLLKTITSHEALYYKTLFTHSKVI